MSQASAIAMAQAVRAQFKTTFGLGVTGVPGPGEREGQPVGLAYFAIASAETVHTQEMRVAPADDPEAPRVQRRADRAEQAVAWGPARTH